MLFLNLHSIFHNNLEIIVIYAYNKKVAQL